MKMRCDCLYGWMKKWSHTQKSHQNWSTQEIQLGTQKKNKKNWRDERKGETDVNSDIVASKNGSA